MIENTKNVTKILVDYTKETFKNIKITLAPFDTKVSPNYNIQDMDQERIHKGIDKIKADSGTVFFKTFEFIS